MQPFTTLTAVAAPLPRINVDTDLIIPKQFLKTVTRDGFGKSLFHELRYDEAGRRLDDFVLHQPPFAKAGILLALDNFGCGSSREHAVWALLDFGIRCVIAPSFADIFYNNCFKNGVLPVVLEAAVVQELMARSTPASPLTLTVDLPQQTVSDGEGFTASFAIDSSRKDRLLEGLDDIGLTLKHEAAIADFEVRQRAKQPWLWCSQGRAGA
ncbi:MAG: 3-isopropylmalate dehydratase small subunit [Alphaproteobacteria bacterium]|nr:3-isopropylmalate dehydratase small subunit [Alphaproteobacteria bacterium]